MNDRNWLGGFRVIGRLSRSAHVPAGLGLLLASCQYKDPDPCLWDCRLMYSATSYHRACVMRRQPCSARPTSSSAPAPAPGSSAGPASMSPSMSPPRFYPFDGPRFSESSDGGGDTSMQESAPPASTQGTTTAVAEAESSAAASSSSAPPSEATEVARWAPERSDYTCERDSQCGPGRCDGGECFYGCFTDAECGTGDRCAAESAQRVCEPDLSPPIECTRTSECGERRVCLNATCFEQCVDTADCSNEMDRCLAGLCVPDRRALAECVFDSECAPGEVCLDGSCQVRSDAGTIEIH